MYVQRGSQQDVLNGIAYHNETNVFLLTGKLWPRYYLSRLDRNHIWYGILKCNNF